MALEIFDPTTEATGRSIAYVPRPKALAGLRLGLVDNTKRNSDQLLLRIAALLERDYDVKTHVLRRKRASGVALHAEVIDEFKAQCDVVIAGVGD